MIIGIDIDDTLTDIRDEVGAEALKYAKINYYTLKSLIENGNSFKGKIYSYKDKL